MHLQAPDLVGAGLGQPGQHRAAGIGFDELLGHPEALRGRLGLDPHHLVGGNAELGQAAGMGLLWRGHEQELAALLDQGGQAAAEQAPLAQRGLGGQDFGQGARGPAAPGQGRVQKIEARGDSGMLLERQVIARPDGLPHRVGKVLGVEGAGGGWHGKIL